MAVSLGWEAAESAFRLIPLFCQLWRELLSWSGGTPIMEDAMERIKTDEARNAFGEVVNRVAYGKERIVLERRGKPLAALIPIEDLHLLERLIEEEEDRIDLEAVRAAKAEPGPNIPYEQVRKELGLDELSAGDASPGKAHAGRAAKRRRASN